MYKMAFLFCLFVSGCVLWGQQEADTLAGSTAYKAFAKKEVKNLQESDTYIYPRTNTNTITPWQRFLRWLRDFITFNAKASWWEWLLYLFVFVVLLFAAIRLLGIRYNRLFGDPEKATPLDFTAGEENLDDFRFEEEIEAALHQRNWRLVIRLHYLQALYLLAQAELLEVKPGKTSLDYRYELKTPKARESFSGIARLFDYIWYGQFEAAQGHAEQSAAYINQIKKIKRGNA